MLLPTREVGELVMSQSVRALPFISIDALGRDNSQEKDPQKVI